MNHIDPQKTIELYKKHNIKPLTGAMCSDDKKYACAGGIHWLSQAIEGNAGYETCSPLDDIGISYGWFTGFSDAFDAKPNRFNSGNISIELLDEYLKGYTNGLEVRESVEKEFGRIPSYTEIRLLEKINETEPS